MTLSPLKTSYRQILLIIVSGYLLVLLGLIYTSSKLYNTVVFLESQSSELYRHPFKVNAAAREMGLAMAKIRNEVLFVLVDKRHPHPELAKAIDELDAVVDRNFITINTNFLGDMNRIRETEKLIQSWRVARNEMVHLIEQRNFAAADSLLIYKVTPIYDAIILNIDYVVNFSSDKARFFTEQAMQESSDTQRLIKWSIGIFALFILSSGVVSALVVLLQLRKRDQLIYREQSQIQLLTDDVPGYCTFLLDGNGCVASWNTGAKKLKGYEAPEILDKSIECFYTLEDIKSGKPSRLLELAKTQGVCEDLGWRVRKDGGQFFADVIIKSFRDSEEKLIGFIKITRDISERQLLTEQVKRLAFHDNLTDIPNRRLLNDRLAQALAASKRSGFYGALMFLDLDNFKPLNDSQGHAAGDMLLIEVARRLEISVREVDTVARFGGDEFVVMLTELSQNKSDSISQARSVAEKISAILGEPYFLTVSADTGASLTVEHRCTASMGVVLFNGNTSNFDEVLRQADDAMYQAKAAGRNRIQFDTQLS